MRPRIRRLSPPAGRRESNPSADSRGEGHAHRPARPGPRSRCRPRAAVQPHRHVDRPPTLASAASPGQGGSVPAREFTELLGIVRSYQRSQALAVAARLRHRGSPCRRSAIDRSSSLKAPTPMRRRSIDCSARSRRSGSSPNSRGTRSRTTRRASTCGPTTSLSVAPVAEMFCSDYEWTAWGALDHSVRTGENAATHALGMDVWEHRRRHPEAGRTFDAAMRTITAWQR